MNISPTKDADAIYLLHGLIPTDVTWPACSYSSADDYLLSYISLSLIWYLLLYEDKTFFSKSLYLVFGFNTNGLISYMNTFLSLPPDTIYLESCDIFTVKIPSVCPTNVWIGSFIPLFNILLRLYNLMLLSCVFATAENVPHWLIVTADVVFALLFCILTSSISYGLLGMD